jgi:uncharacterized protein (TIGR00369 family)
MQLDFPTTGLESFEVSDADALHRMCFACSSNNPIGLHLEFEPMGSHAVRTEFLLDERFQGYTNYVHGGVIATVLDATMTRLLFALGIVGVTVDLNIRYRAPMKVGLKAVAYSELIEHRFPLFHLAGELTQEGSQIARAKARFMVPKTAQNRYKGRSSLPAVIE